MAGRVFFFLQQATYEPAFQAASMGITAAAMGDEVYFVFAFDALRQLARGRARAVTDELGAVLRVAAYVAGSLGSTSIICRPLRTIARSVIPDILNALQASGRW